MHHAEAAEGLGAQRNFGICYINIILIFSSSSASCHVDWRTLSVLQRELYWGGCFLIDRLFCDSGHGPRRGRRSIASGIAS